jgi:hypothetical protein
MGSRVKMFGEKETVISVRDPSKRKWEAGRGVFSQDRVAVKVEFCHDIGNRAHGGWYR